MPEIFFNIVKSSCKKILCPPKTKVPSMSGVVIVLTWAAATSLESTKLIPAS